MDLRPLDSQQKNQHNKLATHIMQSWEWGEFRKSLGTPLLRYGLYEGDKLARVFQLTLHKIPFAKSFVGFLPKGPFPDQDLAQALTQIGKAQGCIFIKTEPDILESADKNLTSKTSKGFQPSPKPMFTKYNFVIDLTRSEEELLTAMHQKTRYNIKVAQKHGVIIEERTNKEGFEIYLKLYFETTRRQKYHGHNEHYHREAWKIMKQAGMARILVAFYQPPNSDTRIPLTAWMLFNFKDTLYYPYGGSSLEYRNVMSSTLLAWEAIKLGKKLKLKTFDLWGALGPNPDPKDPWYGFHHFKEGLGGKLVENIGTFDLVLNQPLYQAFTLIDKTASLKFFLLRLLTKR